MVHYRDLFEHTCAARYHALSIAWSALWPTARLSRTVYRSKWEVLGCANNLSCVTVDMGCRITKRPFNLTALHFGSGTRLARYLPARLLFASPWRPVVSQACALIFFSWLLCLGDSCAHSPTTLTKPSIGEVKARAVIRYSGATKEQSPSTTYNRELLVGKLHRTPP